MCSRLLTALLVSLGLAVPSVPDAAACGDGDGPPAALAKLGTSELLARIKANPRASERDALLELLSRAKVAGTGAKLIAIADARMDDGWNAELYATAAWIDGEAVFDALVWSYWNAKITKLTPAGGAATAGLSVLRERTLAWIGEQIQHATDAARLASLAARVAVPADNKVVVQLIDLTTDPIAQHRLADAAIDNGARDAVLYTTLLASLRSPDANVRADAVWHVKADYVPRAQIAAFRTALEAQLGATATPHLARELIQLGSTDRRVIDELFGRMASKRDADRFGAVLAAASYAPYLDAAIAQEVLNQVDNLLAVDQDERFKRKLDKARALLREALAKHDRARRAESAGPT